MLNAWNEWWLGVCLASVPRRYCQPVGTLPISWQSGAISLADLQWLAKENGVSIMTARRAFAESRPVQES
jgi:hypothetical protein